MTTHNVERSSPNGPPPHFSRLAVMNQENGLPKRFPSSETLAFTQRIAAVSSQRPVARSPSGVFWSWWP